MSTLFERLLEQTLEKAQEDLAELVHIQSSEPSTKTDEYMRGLANGLICAHATVAGIDPLYIEKKVNEYAMSKKDLIDMLVSQGKSWEDIIAHVPAFAKDEEAKSIYKELINV